MKASLRGHAAVVKILLDNGANIDLQNLVSFCDRNDVLLFRRILLHVSMFCVQRGESALILASGSGHLEVVDVLLAYKAQVELQDKVRMLHLQ